MILSICSGDISPDLIICERSAPTSLVVLYPLPLATGSILSEVALVLNRLFTAALSPIGGLESQRLPYLD